MLLKLLPDDEIETEPFKYSMHLLGLDKNSEDEEDSQNENWADSDCVKICELYQSF